MRIFIEQVPDILRETSSWVRFFFFQAEDGIRDFHVTGVQTCALPIWGAASDPGLVRKNNEDGYRILEEQHLFAVADGMGGHQGGAVAAALALEALRPDDLDRKSVV